MSTRMQLSEYGRTFSTRPRGRELRARALSRQENEDLELDFAGVSSVSYSFADEFVAVLVQDAGQSDGFEVRILDAAPAVARVLARALANRGATVTFSTSVPAG